MKDTIIAQILFKYEDELKLTEECEIKQKEILANEEIFREKLSDESLLNLFDKLDESNTEMEVLTIIEYYKRGFKTGLLLGLEVGDGNS